MKTIILIVVSFIFISYLYSVFQRVRTTYRMIKKRYEEVTKMRMYIHNGQIFSLEDRGFSYIIQQKTICLGESNYLYPFGPGLVEQYWYIKFVQFFERNKDNIKPMMN